MLIHRHDRALFAAVPQLRTVHPEFGAWTRRIEFSGVHMTVVESVERDQGLGSVNIFETTAEIVRPFSREVNLCDDRSDQCKLDGAFEAFTQFDRQG